MDRAIVCEANRSALEVLTFRRALLELRPGDKLPLTDKGPHTFDSMMELLGRFKILQKLAVARPGCVAVAQCSCEVGQKAGMCPCSLAHALHTGAAVVPHGDEEGTDANKKGPGRKRKTVACQQRQFDNETPLDCPPTSHFSPIKKPTLSRRVSF